MLIELVEKHQCEHEGCQSTDTIRCRVTDYSVTIEEQHPEEVFWYCPEHCTAEGFCWQCGEFWAGITSFDMRANGLCDACNDELESELAASEEDYEA